MVDIPYDDVYDLAKLTLLVYEYGKSFTLDENQTVEGFVQSTRSVDNKMTDLRKEIIGELSTSSPHGRVVEFYSIDKTDLQVGITISETHKRICVVFRGSESKYDWYYDLSFMKRQLHDDVYVHSGFYNQLHTDGACDTLKSKLFELIKKYPDYSVYITGHSLGGALCTLFGYELSCELQNPITVVSFASPRVGNPAFRKAFDNTSHLSHYRVSNEHDIVTAAPMINYQHVGTNISLKEDTYEIFQNYSYNTWYRYSLFKCYSISEHYMDEYITRLRKMKW